ncbi:MAG: aldehyde dehydrogenase, partial [Stutzerimonas stutzeri]
MTDSATRARHVRNPRAFFLGGEWVEPSAATVIDVIDSASEEVFLTVAEAQAADVER